MSPFFRRWAGLVVASLVLLLAAPVHAGPGMPDPRQMSGIPRPDPQIPAGEITVRVLLGSFDSQLTLLSLSQEPQPERRRLSRFRRLRLLPPLRKKSTSENSSRN